MVQERFQQVYHKEKPKVSTLLRLPLLFLLRLFSYYFVAAGTSPGAAAAAADAVAVDVVASTILDLITDHC